MLEKKKEAPRHLTSREPNAPVRPLSPRPLGSALTVATAGAVVAAGVLMTLLAQEPGAVLAISDQRADDTPRSLAAALLPVGRSAAFLPELPVAPVPTTVRIVPARPPRLAGTGAPILPPAPSLPPRGH